MTADAWMFPMDPVRHARSVNDSTPSPSVCGAWTSRHGVPAMASQDGGRGMVARYDKGVDLEIEESRYRLSSSSRAATFASKLPSSPAASAGL